MVRRKRFRTYFDQAVDKLRDFANVEKAKRAKFSKDVHTYLPSQFLPTLRDNAPTIVVEGPRSELDFPDLEDAVVASLFNEIKIDNPFRVASHNSIETNENDNQRKVDEMVKELELRQAEYASNLREQENMLQKIEIQLKVKEDWGRDLIKSCECKDIEIKKLKTKIDAML